MSFLDHIARCNNAKISEFEPWFAGGMRAGFVHRESAPLLGAQRDLFERREGSWYLSSALDTPAARTAALGRWLDELRLGGMFKGWRGEMYDVTWIFGRPALLQMERACVPWLGVRAFGPHMTGYVRKPDGLHIWVPRRAYDKPTYPGELDNTVAGGQPTGIGIHDNLVKECGEEAGIPPEVARHAIAVSHVTYWHQSGPTLKPDVMTCFDLELPADFVPRATDGEVHAFELWPLRRVFETVRDSFDFKYNCNLVLIDFFLRHGLLGADDPDFPALVEGLRPTQPPTG
jgi:hypothetical protein